VQLGFVRMSEGAKLTDRGQRKRGEAAVSLLRRASVFFVDQHHVGGDACSPHHGRSAGLFRIDFNELAPSPIHALSYAYYLANKIVVITSAPEVPMNLQQYLIDAQSTCRESRRFKPELRSLSLPRSTQRVVDLVHPTSSGRHPECCLPIHQESRLD
jgi:hypothetical protein